MRDQNRLSEKTKKPNTPFQPPERTRNKMEEIFSNVAISRIKMAKGIQYMRPMHPRNATSSETRPNETFKPKISSTDSRHPLARSATLERPGETPARRA